MSVLGVDVSQFQSNVNYDVLKSSSQFVIIKASEGTSFIDPKFTRNRTESRRVGVARGYYHFARPDLGNSPIAEANFFLGVCSGLQEGELLVLDYEPQNQKQSDVNWCKSWLDHVYQQTKCHPLIYLNQSQVKAFDWSAVINADYALWIAAYTFSSTKNNFQTGQWPAAVMQQYSDKLQVNGISGAVDGDVFFGDLDTFKKYGMPSVIINPPMNQKYSFRQVIQFFYRIMCNADPTEDEYQSREAQQKSGWNEIQIGIDILKNDSRATALWHNNNLADSTIKQLALAIVNKS